MKLLLIIAALAAPVARANFQFSRKKLSDAAIASLRTEVEAGARFVTATDELAKLFNVEAGHAVPAKVARGSVLEHQDKHADFTAADLVQLLYLDGEKDHKFTLRDLRTGEEHSTAVEPGLLIEYDNQYYTHRVDARSSSARLMLGPTSAKAGVLEPVGCRRLSDQSDQTSRKLRAASCTDADDKAYTCQDGGVSEGSGVPPPIDRPSGEPYCYKNVDGVGNAACCTSDTDCSDFGESECIAWDDCSYDDIRRNLRALAFGTYTVADTVGLGQCVCKDGHYWGYTAGPGEYIWTCVADNG